MEFTYFTGMIISFIIGYVYVYYIRKDFEGEEAILNLIVVTLFSWLGVAITVMATMTVTINYFSKKG